MPKNLKPDSRKRAKAMPIKSSLETVSFLFRAHGFKSVKDLMGFIWGQFDGN